MLESRLDIQYNGVGTRAALSDKETAHGCEAVWLSTEEMIHVCKRAQGQGVREAAFEDTPFLRAQHFLWLPCLNRFASLIVLEFHGIISCQSLRQSI
jgi:hypothetical protein